MMTKKDQTKIKALGLCSGGLDSILSALVLQKQGIEVAWITFETPFFAADKARQAARMTGIPLTVANITPAYVEMLKNPPCGYGKFMNPCLDCHALMFRLAGEAMQARGFDFLFSGEVLGQRPMSQTKPSLRYVEKNSGFDGYIVRPLSAKRLPATIPEQNGWIDKEALLDITGRSRKRQIQLAAEWGVSSYPAPAGGCLLTDKGYSMRLKDLFAHQQDGTEAELHLLKYGRHFRLANGAKLIVGRTQKDNQHIQTYCDPEHDALVKMQNYPGPLGLIPKGGDAATVFLAAAICAGYSKAPDGQPVAAVVTGAGGSRTIRVLPVAPGDVKKLLI
jgi:tRNA U34 2-thiouridine synthase MnmA/TrmU